MRLEVLVSTMNEIDDSLIKKMNLQSDAIIINQTDEVSFRKVLHNGKTIRMYSFNERGIGLSRNNALMRSNADICIFADDDLRYVDGYEKIIVQAFLNNPKADVIIFNVPSLNEDRQSFTITEENRVRFYNSLRYGAVRIAVRNDKIKKANIYFSLLYGGGAKFGSGEDSLFITECLNHGLKIYSNSGIIGYVSQEDSTWFEGYTPKFFEDKGYLVANSFKLLKYPVAIYFSFKWRNMSENNFFGVYKLISKGMKNFKNVDVLR